MSLVISGCACLLTLSTLAWWRYRWVQDHPVSPPDTDPYRLRNSNSPTPWERTPHQRGVQYLHEIFERSARQYPNYPALSVPETGEQLSYRELDHRANQIAQALGTYITGPNQIVGVCIKQNCADVVAAHLGILKAGAAQIFLDPDAPPGMLKHMLEDACPVVILHSSDDEAAVLGATSDLLINIDEVAAGPAITPCSPWLGRPADTLASLFYTSGTTGTPKGVECAHAGYINLAHSYADFFDLCAGRDATSLTSSLGYDGSISELYSAWVFGAEVVLLTKEQIRSGPDLMPLLREHEVTALFCPPVLLSTLSDQPEKDLPYPICRYIIPAGEPFPANLVEPWSRARRQIVNTYGPTEVSTDTSRQLLRPDEPVTIGAPFPGVDYFILDPDNLTPLPHGSWGELCIGGIQLAMGYRNLPRQTQDAFVEHPDLGRLYRTGDYCRVDPVRWQVELQGRIDAQFKVRGHRVEAQGIESYLQDHITAIETAVVDLRDGELIAFVLAPSLSEAGEIPAETAIPASTDWTHRVQQQMAHLFPTHAIPSRFFLVSSFALKPLSGKIDRNALPHVSTELPQPLRMQTTSDQEPAIESSGQQEILEICRSVLGERLALDDDFVTCGAHSIAIAQLSQRLRTAGYYCSVRLLLTDARSARKLHKQSVKTTPGMNDGAGESGTLEKKPKPAPKPSKRLSPRQFGLLQTIGITLLRLPIWLFITALIVLGDPEDALLTGEFLNLIWVTAAGYLAYMTLPLLNLFWVMCLRRLFKRRLDQHLQPGQYPKWSVTHWWVWWTNRQQNQVLQSFSNWLRSPTIYAWALRQLGASIGARSHFSQSAEFHGPLCLLSAGVDTTIQSGAHINTLAWEGETLTIDRVSLGDRVKIGHRATVDGGTTMSAGCWLTPLSAAAGTNYSANQMLVGVPASAAGEVQTPTRPRRCFPNVDQRRHRAQLLGLVAQIVMDIALFSLPSALILATTSQWLLAGFSPISDSGAESSLSDLIGTLLLTSVIGVWISLALSSLLACLFIRLTASTPGLIAGTSARGILLRYRQQKMNQIQRLWTWTLLGQYFRAIAGVRFEQVGATECDVMVNTVPEALSTAADVFMAQGCRTNSLDEEGDLLTLRPLRLGRGAFIGNNSVAESGDLPHHLLLGVSTPIGDDSYRQQLRTRAGPPLVVAGNPPLSFAQTGDSDTGAEQKPGWGLFMLRVTIGDLLGVALTPAMPFILVSVLLVATSRLGLGELSSAILSLLTAPWILALMALSVQKILVARGWGRHHATPFWSVRHFTYFFAQDCFFRWAGPLLNTMAESSLGNPLLRAFGCRLGSNVLLREPLQTFDWYAVDIDANSVVDGQLQLHSFENRLLSIKASTVGAGSALNAGTTLMGGAELGEGTTLAAGSLVLKEMVLPSGVHGGSPAEPVAVEAGS